MNWVSNEVLFYGGILVSAGSLVSGIIYYVSLYIRKLRLNVRLDEEYGKI